MWKAQNFDQLLGDGESVHGSAGGPKGHINIRIRDSGSKAQCKGDTRNRVQQDSPVYVVFGGPRCAARLVIRGRAIAESRRTLHYMLDTM